MRVCFKSTTSFLPFLRIVHPQLYYFGQIKRFVLPDLGESAENNKFHFIFKISF